VRLKRIPPLTDNKVLLSWNALMLKALAESGQLLGNKIYQDKAIELAEYLDAHFYQAGKLLRVSLDNKVSTKAVFEDFVYLADAYLSVFDLTQNQDWLEKAQKLSLEMQDKFWDKENFGFYISEQSTLLGHHKKESYDGAIASSNGIAYQVLLRLFTRTGKRKYRELAEQLLSAFAEKIAKQPVGVDSFIQGLLMKEQGELSLPQYLYGDAVLIKKIQTKAFVKININLAKGWHINANKVLDEGLIATKIIGNIKNVNYPKGDLVSLAFSKNKVATYQDKVEISFERQDEQPLKLQLQACNETVCLPPKTIILY
jgi:uncharacterized protein YyaL (SSP411 family)